MARPSRIEFPGAIYHVTTHSEGGSPIFSSADDRRQFLQVLGQSLERFDASALGFALLGDHYRVVIYTRKANLSALMRHVNGVYTQDINRQYGRGGRLFQGRFKAVLVDPKAYLLPLLADLERAPVQVKLCKSPGAWAWSSYQAHTGAVACPAWLDTVGLHAALLGRAAKGAADHRKGAELYAKAVAAEPAVDLWGQVLQKQIYLGDDAFVARMQALGQRQASAAKKSPKPSSATAVRKVVDQCLRQSKDDLDEALWRAHTQHGISITALGASQGRSLSWASKRISIHESTIERA